MMREIEGDDWIKFSWWIFAFHLISPDEEGIAKKRTMSGCNSDYLFLEEFQFIFGFEC